ncbi:MAG: N-formylglutamate amidohydrolase protein [Rhizobium sp.]|nr:N-formylglutamate amidohydrolase protein [Rhizobium sp.]
MSKSVTMQDFPAFEIIPGGLNTGCILLGDHATNRLPPEYGSLGLGPDAFKRHIAFDIGIEPLTRALAMRLGVPAVMSGFSRLLIDPNRGEDDPTLIMKISDGAIIPGNHPISETEWDRRIALYHRPYHQAVGDVIADVEQTTGAAPLVISLHSFTPFWKGVARPWHASVLWDADPRAPIRLLQALGQMPDIVTGDNEPYDGALRGDTLYRHCMKAGIPHLLLEVRQDLIGDEAGVASWCNRLAPVFAALNADPELHKYEVYRSRTGPYEA